MFSSSLFILEYLLLASFLIRQAFLALCSIWVAEKLSMKKIGEITKTCKEAEMLHDVYVLRIH